MSNEIETFGSLMESLGYTEIQVLDVDTAIKFLRQSFAVADVKKEILDEQYYEKNISSGRDSLGFCYYACEVIYRLFGGKEKWKFMMISNKDWSVDKHTFLINKETNERLDFTADQFTEKIPYHLARGVGLRRTSNKAKKLAKMALGVVLE